MDKKEKSGGESEKTYLKSEIVWEMLLSREGDQRGRSTWLGI